MTMTTEAPAARGSVPGDNRAGMPIDERLAEDYSGLQGELDSLAALANKAPKKVANDDDLAAVGKIVIAARALDSKIEQTRKREKQPFLEGGRTVDNFFSSMTDRTSRIAKVLQGIADTYQREKAAEARRKAEEAARKAREEEERQRRIAEEAEAKNRLATAAKHEERAEEAAKRAEQQAAVAEQSAADLTRFRTDGLTATAQTSWSFEIENIAELDLNALRPYLARPDLEKAIRNFVRVGGRELKGVRIFQDVKASFR